MPDDNYDDLFGGLDDESSEMPDESQVDAVKDLGGTSVDDDFSDLDSLEEVFSEPDPLEDDFNVDELIPPIDASDDLVVNFPLENIKDLVDQAAVVQVPVHGIFLHLLKSGIVQNGFNADDPRALELLSKSLEEQLTKNEVADLKRRQTIASANGSNFKVSESEHVLTTDTFRVLIPEICAKIKVEAVDTDIPLVGMTVLNEVKPEFVEAAGGLNKILKSSSAAELLRIIQEDSPEGEMEFYFKIIQELGDKTSTYGFALVQMRMLMQYALNCDTLALKAILTKEVIDSNGQ